MEIPHELFYLSAFSFAVMAIVTFNRAYREKERFYNIGGILCLLGLVHFVRLGRGPVSGNFLGSRNDSQHRIAAGADSVSRPSDGRG